MPSFGMISIASAMVQSVFFCERSRLRRALRKAQYNDFESSFVNRMTTGTLKNCGEGQTEGATCFVTLQQGLIQR
jgi:hypothetical protein